MKARQDKNIDAIAPPFPGIPPIKSVKPFHSTFLPLLIQRKIIQYRREKQTNLL